GGTLRAARNAALAGATGGSVSTTVNAGTTLDFNDLVGMDVTHGIRDLQGAGRVHIGTDTASILDIASGSFNGGITGAGGVRITNLNGTNNSTLVLGGTSLNTYTGPTGIDAGHTLRASAANAFASGSVHEVASGATLDLNNFDQEVQ